MQKNELIKMEYVILAFSKLHFNTGELTSLEDTFFYVWDTVSNICGGPDFTAKERVHVYYVCITYVLVPDTL